MRTRIKPVCLGAFTGLFLVTVGCATKKHVREAIAPTQNHVNQPQDQSSFRKQAHEKNPVIGDLDRQIATGDEMTVNTGKKAAKVNQGADSADDVGRLSQQKLDTSLRNLNGYKLIATEAVYFDLNRSLLTKEDCEKLDETLGKLAHLKVYVLEVEARADHPGDQAYNRELCRRRAQAVVNYLTVEHGVPLRAIRQLGVGKDSPDTENTMSVDREQVGRVDVKIYALNIT